MTNTKKIDNSLAVAILVGFLVGGLIGGYFMTSTMPKDVVDGRHKYNRILDREEQIVVAGRTYSCIDITNSLD